MKKQKAVVFEGEYIPARQTDGAACWDLRVAEDVTLPASGVAKVGLGVRMKMPKSWAGLLFIRSGWAAKGLCLANGAGVIDSDYRGELSALVHNAAGTPVHIENGTRLVQIMFIKPKGTRRRSYVVHVSELPLKT